MADFQVQQPPLPDWMGSQPPVPSERNFGTEFGQYPALVQGSYIDASQLYGDTVEGLSRQQLWYDKMQQQRQWNFYKQHYPEMVQMQQQAQQQMFPTQLAQQQQLYEQSLQAQQQAAITGRTDAYKFLTDYGASADWAGRQATPLYGASYNQVLGQVNRIGQRDPQNPFTGELDKQALSELQLGGALTPEEERMAQQSARSAFAARGQAMSDPAALAEVLNRESYSQARLRERQGIAGGREQAALGREATEVARQQAEQQFALQAGEWANKQNPIWGLMGMGYSTPNASISPLQTSGVSLDPTMTQGFTRSVSQPTGPEMYTSLFGSTLGYGQDVYSSNMNLQADLYNSWMNNAAAIEGANIQSQSTIEAANIQSAGTMAGAKTAAGGATAGAAIGAVGAIAGGVAIAF